MAMYSSARCAGGRRVAVWVVACVCATLASVRVQEQTFAAQPQSHRPSVRQHSHGFARGVSGSFGASAIGLHPVGDRAGKLEPRSHAFAVSALALLIAATGRKQATQRSPGTVAVRAEEGKLAKEGKPEPEDKSSSLLAQASLFLSYFALQSCMSFYMKWLLSKVPVTAELIGVPASFLVTTSQQTVSLILMLTFIACSWLVGKPYRPKKLASRREVLLVLALSVSFTCNIGLNLLALSLVPLSLSMIIRACSPLSTAMMQTALMRKKQDISPGEWACMVCGVFFASAVVVAQSGGVVGQASFAFFFGVAMVVTSLFSGALDFVFKGILGGGSVKLNAIDTTCYMALPVALLTSLIGFVFAKPVSPSWAAHYTPLMTDWSVFFQIWSVNPAVFGYVAFSGVLATVYNTFVTFMVVKLSPATTAFAGNFNKAATILVSLILLEGTLAAGIRGYVMIGAVCGNIGAFTVYNILKGRRKVKK